MTAGQAALLTLFCNSAYTTSDAGLVYSYFVMLVFMGKEGKFRSLDECP